MKEPFPVDKYNKTLTPVISLLMTKRAVCGKRCIFEHSIVQMLLIEIVYSLGIIAHNML